MSDTPPRQFVPSPPEKVEPQAQPTQTAQPAQAAQPAQPRLELTGIKQIQFTDALIYIKADVSVQATTSHINYISLNDGKLEIHTGDVIICAATPNLTIDNLQQLLPPSFYKLKPTDQSVICFNMKKIGLLLLRPQGVISVLFNGGEAMRFTVPEDNQEKIYMSFTQHHETVIRN